jgi:hypothetical protein
VEAKRRLSAGEFATLHEAQLAIAREHGLPSWTALKEYISAGPGQASPVLAQARWVITRFAAAGTPAGRCPVTPSLVTISTRTSCAWYPRKPWSGR